MADQPRDRIEVRGLELLVLCGVLPEEQARKQPFRFDLDLYLDLGAAGQSDELADTVNYGEIVDLLAAELGADRFFLLERMAERAAELVMTDPLVDEVTVTARKIRPPVPVHVDTTGVRIHRRRPADRV
ncbi:MAG: dihydroneopterin aldolase [Acidimicrobiia bacterium]|nr:dihydroneopterin aldolase [Acidimicrobiia bacterium]